MKKFILPLISLTMTCCDSCDNKNNTLIRSRNFLEILENYLKDSNTKDEDKKILKDVTPALLMLEKIIYADKKLKPEQAKDSLLKSTLKLIQDGTTNEDVKNFLQEINTAKITESISFFQTIYLNLYNLLEKKNIFRTIKQDEIIEVKKDTPLIFEFNNDTVETLKKKILDNKKESDNSSKKKVTIAELLNEYLREKKWSLSDHATYIVVKLDSLKNVKVETNSVNTFERSLKGEAVLEYVCALSNEAYNERNFLFDENDSPCKLLNFNKQEENNKNPVLFLFRIKKISHKELKTMLDD